MFFLLLECYPLDCYSGMILAKEIVASAIELPVLKSLLLNNNLPMTY